MVALLPLQGGLQATAPKRDCSGNALSFMPERQNNSKTPLLAMTLALLATLVAMPVSADAAGNSQVPCWGDLTQNHQSTIALPRFVRSMRQKACDQEILEANKVALSRSHRSETRNKAESRIASAVRFDHNVRTDVIDRRWFVKLVRGKTPEAGTDHVIVTNSKGVPLRSRKAIKLVGYKTRDNETIRSVAYRAATSPEVIAHANGLEWDPEGTPLPPGLTLKVPLRYRSASGFATAVRLTTGPGVLARRDRTGWGRPYMVRLLRDAFHATHRRWPNRHPAVVHDLSRLGGGSLRPHKSHRAGRDIDIGYFTREADRKHWGSPRLNDIDYARLWFFVDRLERSGQLAAIYMSPRIQRRLYRYALERAGAAPERLKPMFQYPAAKGARRTLIRQSPGHRDHLHMRFDCPADLEELAVQS